MEMDQPLPHIRDPGHNRKLYGGTARNQGIGKGLMDQGRHFREQMGPFTDIPLHIDESKIFKIKENVAGLLPLLEKFLLELFGLHPEITGAVQTISLRFL